MLFCLISLHYVNGINKVMMMMMSGEGPEQGTSALLHEDSGRPERTAGMRLAPELATNGAHETMGLCVLTASLRKLNGRRHSRPTAAGLAAGQRIQ